MQKAGSGKYILASKNIFPQRDLEQITPGNRLQRGEKKLRRYYVWKSPALGKSQRAVFELSTVWTCANSWTGSVSKRLNKWLGIRPQAHNQTEDCKWSRKMFVAGVEAPWKGDQIGSEPRKGAQRTHDHIGTENIFPFHGSFIFKLFAGTKKKVVR